MDCPHCDFRASWGDSQLNGHKAWHSNDNKEEKAFKCHLCPCSVSELNDFKFHLQFHKQDSKVRKTYLIHVGYVFVRQMPN